MTEAQNIDALIKDKTPDEALRLIESLPSPADAAAEAALLVAKGKIYWRMGRRAQAISAYSAADRLLPHSEATTLLEHSNAIMDFFNPDLLNP